MCPDSLFLSQEKFLKTTGFSDQINSTVGEWLSISILAVCNRSDNVPAKLECGCGEKHVEGKSVRGNFLRKCPVWRQWIPKISMIIVIEAVLL